MDPCPFVRLTVDSLLLKLPPITRPAGHAGIHPTTTPCFCTLTLVDLVPSPSKSSPLPLSSPTDTDQITPSPSCPSISFTIDPTMLQRLNGRCAELLVSVYAGHQTGHACGVGPARAIGRVRISVDAEKATSQAVMAQSGWVGLGAGGALLHIVVRAEPDPRYVFQFGGEPECSPVVFQIQGNWARSRRSGCAQQPVFSCRFNVDRRRSTRSRSLPPPDRSTKGKIHSWLDSLWQGDISPRALKNPTGRPRSDQRKGWTVTIHDLSGSPVAAASMVTPFVPSPGSARVSRSNPGAWLIMRPDQSCPTTWHPWARLEGWRERRPSDSLGLRFELTDPTSNGTGAPIAEISLGAKKGGQFVIETGLGSLCGEGFVMGTTVEGEGKISKPTVQVGVRHVTCMADVALFIALSAAVDLSMDACRLFSQKLRKELCVDMEEVF
ncbi:hypothetical protein LUZ63_019486 [Rhynchospora breviuscula]|uniref:Uncharacterized protein n=1 Tax=Rhynchospora breviuscula TaxID=2022672 RepID=A0A9Q0C6C4_9POAL|nr:hypothetical protein LUZ63_019486 [Rhynchospora breviuscula]